MDDILTFTQLNDFIFCPVSIYFHGMYEGVENLLFTGEKQLKGKAVHRNIDNDSWSKSDVICGQSFYSDKYRLIGKIDKYYPELSRLVESKREIKTIYDGYVFQLYAQYFAMTESGIEIKSLALHSVKDNKTYEVRLPEDDADMLFKFESTISEIRTFKFSEFKPSNIEKCKQCIYASVCSWGLE